jgi:glycosyltransferase involved in cell wall biosynthesis
MKISIVTLSFNQREYLQQAIDSVLSQNYCGLEYIVVDPGSSDGSRELIGSYGRQIALKIFEPDRGAADGLNKGFARATGEVFGFLNADDFLLPGSLKRVASFFEAHPQCDIAMGDGYKVDGHGRRIRHFHARDFSVRGYFYGGSEWLQQSTFFRAEAYNRSPKFNTANRTCWDGELFVNLAKQGARIEYIRGDLGCFRIHETSISGSGRTNGQYRQDSRRIFRELQGHGWGANDEVLRFMYRAGGLAKRLRHKLQSRPEKGAA